MSKLSLTRFLISALRTLVSMTLYIYIYALNLAILFYKITFCPFNNIFDSFQSNIIVINLFTTFLYTVEIQILIGSHLNLSLTSLFYLTNNHSLYQQYTSSTFVILKAIKKFIDLKYKTTYISPKTFVQQQKSPIAKLKKNKSN